MVIFRPKLNEKELSKSLGSVFLLLGNAYDFKFDFTNAADHCCTEVIYQAINGVGPVKFSLTRRMGTETLSADDIVLKCISASEKSFDFILLAEKDKKVSGLNAKILTGEKGFNRLVSLMEIKAVNG